MNHIIKQIFIIVAIIFFVSCSENITDNKVENIAPDTHLFLYPDSSVSQQQSKLKVNWWGDDPDGLVTGYYFQWKGLDDGWTFTTKNDSTFYLPIGSADTNYSFTVMAADNGGNKVYDENIIRNGIDLGAEPFIDTNGDGVYNEGEAYYDIGLVDPSPAEQNFPIKNTTPTIEWNQLSSLPQRSLPVISVGWETDDLDGPESISKINLALNDTSQTVSFDNSVKFVTLRIKDVNSDNPQMEILLNGNENDIHQELLQNLKLDADNKLFVQAEDISGAKTKFISLPDSGNSWFVEKPKNDFLLVDDFDNGSQPESFYNNLFGNLFGEENFNSLDIQNTSLPYENVTLLETLKLFKYIYWYSDASPRLDLTNLITQEFISSGGKIAYSMTFADSSESFSYDLATLQNFLLIESFGEEEAVSFMFAGANILKSDQAGTFPNLRTSSTISFVRTYNLTETAVKTYDLSSNQINGPIAFMDSQKSLFFIGLPLHQCDAIEGNVRELIRKIFVDEFGMTL